MNKKNKKTYSTSSGAPIENDISSKTVGKYGPIVFEDGKLFEKLMHFSRERVPERVVHAKGAGAYGYFEVDSDFDLSKYTKANFLNKNGKKTDVFVRFSTVGGELGSADSARDPRGFAIKFYTEEGNYDLVGNNTPVFFIRDGLKFPDFIHTQKRNPKTHLKDANMFWDFLSLSPESMHQVIILFSDRGTPKSYRHMNGYGSHTFMWYTKANNYYWVKYHFETDQGHETLTDEEAMILAGEDPDSGIRDLYDNIKNKNFPSWTLSVQIMDPKDINKHDYDPFDVTKVWPHADYPLHKVGKLVLNKNPKNYFNEVEQATFQPSNFVPGIGASLDRMLQARLFSYQDAQVYRVGANHSQLPVNYPKNTKDWTNHNRRDGNMNFGSENNHEEINYYPNSFDAEKIDDSLENEVPKLFVEGNIAHYDYKINNYDFMQPKALYEKVMNDEEREHLFNNILVHIKNANIKIQIRQLALFYKVNENLAKKLANSLNLNFNEIIELSQSI